MSFEDLQAVDFDYGDETFTMISNSGQTRTYKIADEPDLVRDIIESGIRGELEIYVVEEVTASEKRFSAFEQELKEEYKEKWGEDFETWRW
jgi:predicted house-cleaning noncanonical NTP pyrophosphatase (MazG superfamily)